MLDGGTNYGSRTWSGGTIGGAVFGPAGQLAVRTSSDHCNTNIISCLIL